MRMMQTGLIPFKNRHQLDRTFVVSTLGEPNLAQGSRCAAIGRKGVPGVRGIGHYTA